MPSLLTMVPAIIMTSAWRGVARATSKPNRDQSYLAEAALIISIAQQLVPEHEGPERIGPCPVDGVIQFADQDPPRESGALPRNWFPSGKALM